MEITDKPMQAQIDYIHVLDQNTIEVWVRVLQDNSTHTLRFTYDQVTDEDFLGLVKRHLARKLFLELELSQYVDTTIIIPETSLLRKAYA